MWRRPPPAQDTRWGARSLAGQLDSRSPLGVPARGYSLPQDAATGRVVTDASALAVDDTLVSRFGRRQSLKSRKSNRRIIQRSTDGETSERQDARRRFLIARIGNPSCESPSSWQAISRSQPQASQATSASSNSDWVLTMARSSGKV